MASVAGSAPQEKKKRRQNVACDSCRLRRVKCDMLALLTPNDPEGTLSGVSPPLHILVRENPDVSCSNCISKGIRCTTNQIVNPSKPNKGGKRIEEAKKIYGSDGQLLNASGEDEDLAEAGPEEPTPAVVTDGVMAGLSGTGLTPFLHSDFTFNGDSNAGPSTMLDPVTGSGTTQDWSYWGTGTTPLSGIQPRDTTSTYDMAPAPIISVAPDLQATWESLMNPPLSLSQTLAHNPSPPPPVQQHGIQQPNIQMNEAVPTPFPAFQMDLVFNPTTDSFIPRQKEKSLVPQVSEPARPSTGIITGTLSSLTDRVSREGSSISDSRKGFESRKRLRGNDDDIIEITRYPDDTYEPFSIWASDDTVVRWSRREEVGERLADRALGLELSRHLVKVYFQAVHLSLPAVSPESFYMEWQRAGERSDRMSAAQEVLCVVMEAWASRYSDHPVILGLDPSKAITAPKVIQDNGRFTPGTQARAHWGRARLNVCLALSERARRLIDYHGILRKPSVTGVQALTLFSQLQHMSDSKDRAGERMMENQMIHTSIIEQMKSLELMWDSPGHIPIDHGELPVSIGQLRMKQRRLFWTMIVSDAFWAAGTGSEPKISDEDLDSSGAWLLTVEDKLPPSTFKTLAFFMSTYHRLAVIARVVARKLAVPSRRPGRIDVSDFCNKTRSLWRDIKQIYRDVNVRSEELLGASEHDLLGFSPLHYISSLRQSCPFLLLVIHQLVRELLEFRKSLRAAYIYEDAAPTNHRPETEKVAMLEELNTQSIDTLLSVARSQTYMFQTLLPTGMIQAASIFMRVLLAIAQLLAEIPVNEQGYPSNTPGGTDWTWANKQKEVGYCIDALYQLGWAWADIGDVLDHVMVTMERMQPTPEALAAFSAISLTLGNSHMSAQRMRDLDLDARVLRAAMAFWPPTSVPELVSLWSKGVAIGGVDPLDTSKLYPNMRPPVEWTLNSTSPAADLIERQEEERRATDKRPSVDRMLHDSYERNEIRKQSQAISMERLAHSVEPMEAVGMTFDSGAISDLGSTYDPSMSTVHSAVQTFFGSSSQSTPDSNFSRTSPPGPVDESFWTNIQSSSNFGVREGRSHSQTPAPGLRNVSSDLSGTDATGTNGDAFMASSSIWGFDSSLVSRRDDSQNTRLNGPVSAAIPGPSTSNASVGPGNLSASTGGPTLSESAAGAALAAELENFLDSFAADVAQP